MDACRAQIIAYTVIAPLCVMHALKDTLFKMECVSKFAMLANLEQRMVASHAQQIA